MDRNLAFVHLYVKLIQDFLLKIDYSLSCDTIEYAAIIRGRHQFYMAISANLQYEDIQDGHLLDVVIQEPKHVVKAIVLGVGHAGHQRSQVTAHSVLPMTQRPILVHICRALQADWFLFKLDRIAHYQDFCLMGSPNTQGLVCGKVKHPRIQLVWIFEYI